MTAFFILCEKGFKRRPEQDLTAKRIRTNLLLAGTNTILVRALWIFLLSAFFPIETNQGMQVQWVYWILFLDFCIYWQHRVFHLIPFLWRLHWVHHTDLDLDWSSGVRFHPGEILVSLAFKLGIVWMFHIPIEVYFFYELALSLASLFSHSNFRIPLKLDYLLRWLIVTPDMHRIHHSIDSKELNLNFGNILSIWDRIFKSYRKDPKSAQETIALGVSNQRTSIGYWGLIKISM